MTRGAFPRARKRFGQHFLEPAWVDKVVRAIDPQSDELFIEIGPGRGAITRPLLARAAGVVAFEIDRDLAAALQTDAPPALVVVAEDFLTSDAYPGTGRSGLPPRAVRVAGNLPYNVASPIMFRLVEWYDRLAAEGVTPFADATLMLQREVADRLIASPGTKEYGVLSVLMQHRARVEMLLKLPPGAFRPPPKVQSALVRLRFHPPDPPVKDLGTFESLVKAVFTRRRKTLANALRAFRGQASLTPYLTPYLSPGLTPGQTPGPTLDLTRRPETLTVAEFAQLSDIFSSR